MHWSTAHPATLPSALASSLPSALTCSTLRVHTASKEGLECATLYSQCSVSLPALDRSQPTDAQRPSRAFDQSRPSPAHRGSSRPTSPTSRTCARTISSAKSSRTKSCVPTSTPRDWAGPDRPRQFCESDSLEEDDIAYSIGICQALNKIEIELCYNCIVLNSSGDDAAYAMALSEGKLQYFVASENTFSSCFLLRIAAYEEECKEVAGIVDSEALAPASSPVRQYFPSVQPLGLDLQAQ